MLLQAAVDVFLVVLAALVAVAWSTLLERKLLAGSQFRKGPNKVRVKGGLQPLADAAKLLEKATPSPQGAGFFFAVAPAFSLLVTLLMWAIWPHPASMGVFSMGVVWVLALSSIHVLGVILAGWGSNNVYRSLGGVRGVTLVLSYEIPLVALLLALFASQASVAIDYRDVPLTAFNLCAAVWVLVLGCAETHRAPFDFVEAESELVSGFNVEYGA